MYYSIQLNAKEYFVNSVISSNLHTIVIFTSRIITISVFILLNSTATKYTSLLLHFQVQFLENADMKLVSL